MGIAVVYHFVQAKKGPHLEGESAVCAGERISAGFSQSGSERSPLGGLESGHLPSRFDEDCCSSLCPMRYRALIRLSHAPEFIKRVERLNCQCYLRHLWLG